MADHPMQALTELMKSDPEYAWVWHCNLAVPIMDSIGCSHEQANKAEAYLMAFLLGVDITTHEHYQYAKSAAHQYHDIRIAADQEEYRHRHPRATPMSALTELADRVEAAEGADRDLDEDIMTAVQELSWAWWESLDPKWWGKNAFNPTASIDAAMTLIPADMDYTIEPDAAWVRWMGKDDVEEAQCVLSGRGGKQTALAVTVAALRARAGEIS